MTSQHTKAKRTVAAAHAHPDRIDAGLEITDDVNGGTGRDPPPTERRYLGPIPVSGTKFMPREPPATYHHLKISPPDP